VPRSTISSAPDFNSEVVRFVSRSDALPDHSTYVVSAASDRMGYRLERANDVAINGASVTSEAVCAGAIQLPPDGQPIVLMADSPTVGGYKVGGTVISADLPILAQCMPGRQITLRRVTIEDAQAALIEREKVLSSLTA
jgi:antagonist of KipI